MPAAGAPSGAPEPAIDLFRPFGRGGRTHAKWARAIARGVRYDFKFLVGSQEERDLEAVAMLVLVEYAARFDPRLVRADSTADALFENWAAQEVRSRCRREAFRLRNGGTYHTTNDKAAKKLRVGGLPPDRCANCRDVQFGAGDDEEPPDDNNAWLKARGY